MLAIYRIMSGKNNVDKRIWFSTVGEEREDGARTRQSTSQTRLRPGLANLDTRR